MDDYLTSKALKKMERACDDISDIASALLLISNDVELRSIGIDMTDIIASLNSIKARIGDYDARRFETNK